MRKSYVDEKGLGQGGGGGGGDELVLAALLSHPPIKISLS